ncbi:hypothetical protein [Mangrovicella endophytica]|nr:hypothetical protein [Mangrovicella endophytica]
MSEQRVEKTISPVLMLPRLGSVAMDLVAPVAVCVVFTFLGGCVLLL